MDQGGAGRGSADRLFRACAAGALALHAALLLATPGLRGGADLVPHLRLIELWEAAPALRSTYAPAYHALGALLAPALGLAAYTKVFAWLAAAGLIAGFRAFQRAAELPAESAAVFALSPYLLSLTHCTPKIEAAGYAMALAGLALLLRGRVVAAAGLLAATFWVHTAGALFLGLTGGILCLARRDRRGLAALAAGTLLAAPLVVAHLRAGCTLAQALLFSEGDYLRARPLASLRLWPVVVVLANPIAVAAALGGAHGLGSRSRPVALVCVAMLGLYTNELWLAPFGRGTTLNLLRGLTVLAIPVALAAGVALAAHRRWLPWVVGGSALWLAASAGWAVPHSCFVRPIASSELVDLSVDRCTFRWRGPHLEGPRERARAGGEAPAPLIGRPGAPESP
jgi:hypothetical protein